MNKEYPTNLTEKQWQILQKILEPSTRKRKYSLRDIMNCILYVNKTGCQWRMMPKDFPPHNIVFYYFTKWKCEGVFEDIMDTLREKLRVSLGRYESPSIGIIDSRSVKASQHVDGERGIDGNKKVKERKNQVVVNTLGASDGSHQPPLASLPSYKASHSHEEGTRDNLSRMPNDTCSSSKNRLIDVYVL